MYAVYSDNTVGKIYEGTHVTPTQVANYAQAIKSAGASGDSLLKALPENVQQQVIAYMGQNGMSFGQTPITKEIDNADGTKSTIQYNAQTNSWNPVISNIDRNQAIQKYGSTPAVRNFNP